MPIVLSETRADHSISCPHHFPGAVVHFGSELLKDKCFITVTGKDVAKHHAKLVYVHGHFWLVNLFGLPCSVFKPSGRTIFLTVSEPSCDVQAGDSFCIGSSLFTIRDLAPPQREPPRFTKSTEMLPVKQQLQACRARLDRDSRAPPVDPLTLSDALGFSAHLMHYVLEEEIWRQAADEIGKVFSRRWQNDAPAAVLAAATCDAPPAGAQESSSSALWYAASCPLLAEDGGSIGSTSWSSHLGVPEELLAAVHSLTSEDLSPSYYRPGSNWCVFR